METLNLIQGSPEWLAARSKYFTASEAPAMAGVSKYQGRADLLKQKHSGLAPEITEQQQRIFDRGHASEASARAIAEEIIGEDLFPVTGSTEVDGLPLLASFDGITLLHDVLWEHKLINAELRQATADTLHEQYKVQMDQQLLVSGAEKCLFMASDGTKADCNWFWYETTPARKQALLDGWHQFHDDLASHHQQQERIVPAGVMQESLPALRINLTGMVTASNLPEFKALAEARIKAIKTDLVTDQDFADAEQTAKFLKSGEKDLEDAKKKALADTTSIDELFRTVDGLKEQMRQVRLTLEKSVKAEKENRRVQVLQQAIDDLSRWIEQQDCPVRLDCSDARQTIAEAIKGKKTIKGLEDAASEALAALKIQSRKRIELISNNYKLLTEQANDRMFLFGDWAQLIQRDRDFLELHIKTTIADHEKREQQRMEAERERIRQEEEAKAKEAVETERLAEDHREEQAKAEAEAALQCRSPAKDEPGHQAPAAAPAAPAMAPPPDFAAPAAAAYGALSSPSAAAEAESMQEAKATALAASQHSPFPLGVWADGDLQSIMYQGAEYRRV